MKVLKLGCFCAEDLKSPSASCWTEKLLWHRSVTVLSPRAIIKMSWASACKRRQSIWASYLAQDWLSLCKGPQSTLCWPLSFLRVHSAPWYKSRLSFWNNRILRGHCVNPEWSIISFFSVSTVRNRHSNNILVTIAAKCFAWCVFYDWSFLMSCMTLNTWYPSLSFGLM